MRQRRLVLVIAVGAGLVLCTAALASGSARKPLAVKVDHVRVYFDTAGAGKGELLVRAFSKYGRRGAKGRYWGFTGVVLRGPGGRVELADIDKLHHIEIGERVDHRMLLSPKATKRLLGRAGAKARIGIAATAYLIPQRSPGSAYRTVCCEDRIKPTQTTDFPPEQRTFGNGALTISWTETSPYQAYASSMLTVHNGFATDGIETSAGSGVLQSNGSFSATGTDDCGDDATFGGNVTRPNADGSWPAGAQASINWQVPYNFLGGCQGDDGSATYSIDP